MKVLITEQVRGANITVAQLLGTAGHELAYCHPPDDDQTCVGLRPGGRCPLADFDVDVVVDARVAATEFSEAERGSMCAVRQGVPLVITGPVPHRSASPWREADLLCEAHEVVDACSRAVRELGATPHRNVTAAAARVIRQADNGQTPTVALRKRPGTATLDVFITTDRRLPAGLHEAVRAATRAALASYSPGWQYAQVIFRDRTS